jgi:hypothetical protein
LASFAFVAAIIGYTFGAYFFGEIGGRMNSDLLIILSLGLTGISTAVASGLIGENLITLFIGLTGMAFFYVGVMIPMIPVCAACVLAYHEK